MAEPVNETQLVNAITKRVKKVYPGSWVFKVHGGPMQVTGIPDLLIIVNGLLVAAEVKHQKPGESLAHARDRATPGQRVQIGKINAAGAVAGVVTSADETLALIAQAFKKHEALFGAEYDGRGDPEE